MKVDLVQHSCLKKSHRDGRTKFCVVVATGIMASGSGHELPHGRLNMRKNDFPWRVMLQEKQVPQPENRSLLHTHGVAE